MSVVHNQNKIHEQASLAVMKMAMDVASNQSDLLRSLEAVNTKAMETSIQPFLGAKLDIRA